MFAKMFATVPRYITGSLQTIYLFTYYKIVHTVQDRQSRQSNIKI